MPELILRKPDGSYVNATADSAGNLNTNGSGGGGSTTVSTLGQGSKAVTTAGTPVRLSSSSVACSWVTVEAYRSNAGYIAVGGTGISAAAAGTGSTLGAADSATINVSNLNSVYIDSTINGEGVRYTYGV